MITHTQHNCQCERCRDGNAAVDAKEKIALEKQGWIVHYVADDPDSPYFINIHTHGLLENFQHTDLQMCLNCHPHTAMHIFTIVIDEIKKGKKYFANIEYPNIIEPKAVSKFKAYTILFLQAEECGRKVLRLIMPDEEGKFNGKMKEQLQGCVIPENFFDDANKVK